MAEGTQLRSGTIALLAIGSLAGIPGAAQATPQRVLSLPVEAPGLSAEVANAFDDAVRSEIESLSEPRVRLLPRPALSFDGMKLAAGCTASGPECLRIIGRTVGADRVLRVVIRGNANRAIVNCQLVEVDGARQSSSSAELIDADKDSAPEVRVAVAEAFGVRKKVPNGGLLLSADNHQNLTNAEVLLDDHHVEIEDLSSLPPGAHRVELHQKGFQTFIWVGVIHPGKKTPIGVHLEPVHAGAVTKPAPVAAAEPEQPDLSVHPIVPPPHAEAEVAASSGSSIPAVSWVLGGAAIAAGGVALYHALRVVSIENGKGPDACPANMDTCTSGYHAATIATVSWIAAGVLAAGSITSYLLANESRAATTSANVIGGTVDPSAKRVEVSLRF